MPRQRKDHSRRQAPPGQKTSGTPLDDSGGIAKTRLHEACDILERRFGSSSGESWASDSFRVAVAEQSAVLVEWVEKEGLWMSRDHLGLREEGGREHDLYPELEPGRRMWKVTKGGRFGFSWICERLVGTPSDEFQPRFATPLECLKRLVLHNELVEAMNRLEGFTREGDDLAVVTSQRFIPGKNATERQIERYFTQHGARRVCAGAWYQPERNIAVFDAGQSNLIACDGVVVPVDVIPVRPAGNFLQRIRHAAGLR